MNAGVGGGGGQKRRMCLRRIWCLPHCIQEAAWMPLQLRCACMCVCVSFDGSQLLILQRHLYVKEYVALVK